MKSKKEKDADMTEDVIVDESYARGGVVIGQRVVFDDGESIKLRKIPEGSRVLMERTR